MITLATVTGSIDPAASPLAGLGLDESSDKITIGIVVFAAVVALVLMGYAVRRIVRLFVAAGRLVLRLVRRKRVLGRDPIIDEGVVSAAVHDSERLDAREPASPDVPAPATPTAVVVGQGLQEIRREFYNLRSQLAPDRRLAVLHAD